jgi:hypothetical protein
MYEKKYFIMNRNKLSVQTPSYRINMAILTAIFTCHKTIGESVCISPVKIQNRYLYPRALQLFPFTKTKKHFMVLSSPAAGFATIMMISPSVASRLLSKISIVRNGCPLSLRSMGTITQGVEYDTIAREWRCKWSKDDDMKSLQQAQQALNDILMDVKKTAGFKSVHRVVCGGNLDFKVSHNHN